MKREAMGKEIRLHEAYSGVLALGMLEPAHDQLTFDRTEELK